MDIKKVEGTALNETILSSKPIEVSQESENLAIAIKTTVSNALLGALADEIASQGYIEATVESVDQNKAKLILNNGVEIEVNNEASLNLKPNDILKLVISSLNPVILKISDVKTPTSPILVLQKAIADENPQTTTIKNLNSQEISQEISNSGLFYEKKLIDFLLKAKDISSLTKDAKYQLLENISNLSKNIVQSKEQFNALPKALQKAIEDFSNKIFTQEDINTILKENQNIQEQDPLKQVLNLLSQETPSKQDIKLIDTAKNLLYDISKNYILNPQKLPSIISMLSSFSENLPPINDFFKSLQNTLNIKNPVLKELITKNPSLVFELLTKNPEEIIKNIEDQPLKNLILTLSKNIDSVMKELSNQIILNAKNIQDISKHVLKELDKMSNNVSFDTKLNQLKEDLNILNSINLAQEFILQNNSFFVNFEEKSSKKKGFMAFSKKENSYKAFIKLNWEDGFLGSILEMPKASKNLRISFYTDISPLAKALESSKDELKNILKEESLNVEDISIYEEKKEQFNNRVLVDINKSENLNIFS